MSHSPPRPPRRQFLHHSGRWLMGGLLVPFARPALAAAVEDLPGIRRLAFRHTHTGEQLDLAYAVDDRYLNTALARLNRFLRDHYSGEVGQIDPRLFDLLFQLQQTLGCAEPYQVISGYRCAETNQFLKATRGGGVARHSLHMEGRAIDIRLPGVALADVRDAARELRLGGVGYYPHDRFVHVDTGRVRHW